MGRMEDQRTAGTPYLTPRKRHGRRKAGPWLRPARYPCDFKKENGAVCDLESIASWVGPASTPSALSWVKAPVGKYAGVLVPASMAIHNRCALHPMSDTPQGAP